MLLKLKMKMHSLLFVEMKCLKMKAEMTVKMQMYENRMN